MITKSSNISKDIQEFEGKVVSCLPGAEFLVELDNEKQIRAYAAGSVMKNRIRIVEGDRVTVQVSIYGATKGRITFRNP